MNINDLDLDLDLNMDLDPDPDPDLDLKPNPDRSRTCAFDFVLVSARITRSILDLEGQLALFFHRNSII